MKRTPLAALHEARGARWMEHHGWEIPACFSGVKEEYQAIQEGAALIDLSYRGRLLVTGRDRRSWLHGQVTQEINNLPEWRGAYAAILEPRGRMVTDLRVFVLPDALLLDVPAGTATPIPEYLDRYLIMERCEIEDLTDRWALLSLQGPESPYVLGTVLGETVTRLAPWEITARPFEEETLYVTRALHCGEDGFDLYVPARCAAALWGALSQPRGPLAVHSVGWQALNVRRLEAGIPWWGEELDGSLVPLEARLEHAISYTKGCYVGQEIIARIHARGHVNNLMAGFLVHGDRLPPRGAELRHEGQKVGRVATALHSPRLDRPIALGFLRRELHAPGTRLRAVPPPTGGESQAAGEPEPAVELEVTGLPFVPHDYPPAAARG